MSMFSKLKQYKDLRSQAKKIKSDLDEETVVGRSSGGKVVMEMNGNYEIIDIDIDTDLAKSGSKSKIEKAVKEAHKDAIRQIRKALARRMKDEDIDLSAFTKSKDDSKK